LYAQQTKKESDRDFVGITITSVMIVAGLLSAIGVLAMGAFSTVPGACAPRIKSRRCSLSLPPDWLL
jgi:hypothetical protein